MWEKKIQTTFALQRIFEILFDKNANRLIICNYILNYDSLIEQGLWVAESKLFELWVKYWKK